MTDIRPFCAYRPKKGLEDKIAALPYDVYSREEAAREVGANPYSFLAIDRAETQFDDTVDTYADQVYDKAREMLQTGIEKGSFVKDGTSCYYIYQQIMNGRSQTGIVACASIDDYLQGRIKKHENTREDKELDRIRHVDICNMHTGPIFLAYRANKDLKEITREVCAGKPIYDFITSDGVCHRVWCIDEEGWITKIKDTFQSMDAVYIADGHHRCASAVKVGVKRRQENPGYTGSEEYNYFLAVLFPDDELNIMDYNRVVKDLNGLTSREFLNRVTEKFAVREVGRNVFVPRGKGTFGMYLDDKWYELTALEEICSRDAVKGLDVSVLQDHLLGPVLGIHDPKTDKRIDFVGGIRGAGELERRVHTDMKVAFSMYPTSIGELFTVADAGLLMPPKSTWFEPKLRSGLFLHGID